MMLSIMHAEELQAEIPGIQEDSRSSASCWVDKRASLGAEKDNVRLLDFNTSVAHVQFRLTTIICH